MKETIGDVPPVTHKIIPNEPPWLAPLLNIDLFLGSFAKSQRILIPITICFSKSYENIRATMKFLLTVLNLVRLCCNFSERTESFQTSRHFFSEAFVILSASKLIISSNNSNFIIFSDSKSVLPSLTNRNNQEPII